ncbi:hypothetical protein Asppvi_009355 [Aspergillus pseudoviridinutans]|uniref:Uncharacterized protein n=1 Tax=Aspergillus pseudoviridinutans TaxID=1517512 RepID=A0A9P3EW44_9EURO|nr:uncharacterized protein Asppvi_009355 [Aspergillus pseudoviridinutans]GIJ90401.1 hypothetical protein Asppvi_009355 [Aspergillus pseudoviridinutans]
MASNHKSNSGSRDLGVVSCEDNKAIKAPLPRQRLQDLSNPTFQELFDLAMWRVVEIAIPNPANPPPRLFPTAEKTRDSFFTVQEWNKFGDLESEYGRLSWMLSTFPERGAPVRCAATVVDILTYPCVLSGWRQVSEILRHQVQDILMDVVHSMVSRLPPVDSKTTKDDFLTLPVDYDFASGQAENLFLELFQRSSRRMATLTSKGDYSWIVEYIQIHAFLRDPIGGLKKDFSDQAIIFQDLLAALIQKIADVPLGDELWALLVAQLAQESSFLANPQIDDIAYIHFSGHQQLVYAYVDLHKLARAEFSVPEHVMLIMEEMMQEVVASDECNIVPIIIASVPSVATKKTQKIIIDGNTRATAIMVFRLLSSSDANREDVFANLDKYCSAHGLGPKWCLDLRNVVQRLYATENPTLSTIRENQEALEKFKCVTHLPGLLTQEPLFHTICLQRKFEGRLRILQPMHQMIFNDDSFGLALPARRSQAHGRPKNYVLLPLQ